MQTALSIALETVLACPSCGSDLLSQDRKELRCSGCGVRYQVIEDIPILIPKDHTILQMEELKFREALAVEYFRSDACVLMKAVAKHHCVPLMKQKAREFRERFEDYEWLLDIGIGFGWHWTECHRGSKILGIDISLENLKLARRLLGDKSESVVLVCADAASLPIREHAMSGLWSVQVFQHFPVKVLELSLIELHRVLKDDFRIEVHNLNPALLVRCIYRLLGKRFHCRGKADHMELNRLSPRDWASVWQLFRGGRHRVTYGYSELFFHPDLRLQPRPYPTNFELALVKHAPTLAAIFARQGHVRIESSNAASVKC